MNRKIAINGLCYTQQMSGVQRNAIELIRELDNFVPADQVFLIVPKYTNIKHKFHNIRIVQYGNLKGRAWEQINFLKFVIKNNFESLSLCNTAPLLRPGILLICDVRFKQRGNIIQDKISIMKYIWRDVQNKILCYHSKRLLTISEFSKDEISKFYKIEREKITVIPCAWQHYSRCKSDYSIFEKYPELKHYGYYFAISNIAKHKNFSWVIKEAKINPEEIFVFAGATNPRYFSEKIDSLEQPNIKYLGYISDGHAKALMENCKALLYPSFYEGFGIPPMEALSIGTQVILSDIPVHRETYGMTVHYLNPNKPDLELNEILKEKVDERERVLNLYSWSRSAEIIYQILKA